MNTMQERKEEEELGGVGAVRRAAFLSHLTSTRWEGLLLLWVSSSVVPAGPARGAADQTGSARGFNLGFSLSPRAQLFL